MRRLLFAALLSAGCATVPRVPRPAPPSTAARVASVDWPAAGAEAVQVLQAYLRVDTQNPPGHETLGTDFLAAELQKDGLASRVVEFEPGRGSLIARLPATVPSGEKPLCLLSHVDVVPAEAATWPTDTGPLSGALVDGVLWGRGALDMKGLGVLELQVFRLLARTHVPLTRDVLLLAVADEEVGEGGMRLLTQTLWSELDCGEVLNEGGIGVRDVVAPGLVSFAISVGEKGVLWAELVATGEAGHGSTPAPGRAPERLQQALERLAARKVTPQLSAAMYETLRRTGEKLGGFQGFVMQRPALVDAFAVSKLLAKPSTRASITNTCQVTGFDGRGSSPNVVPSEVKAILDCRVLPGVAPEVLQHELEALVADVPGVSLRVLHAFPGGESPVDDPLFDALARRAVEGRDDAVAGPVISPGYTDSILARRLGAHAYGFVPFVVSQEELGTMHGRHERVRVSDVERGLQVLFGAVVDVAGAP